MIDRIFTPALAFCVLIGAAFAVGSAWFDSRSTVQTVHLPTVQIELVRLPSVEVVAKRVAQPQQIAMLEAITENDAVARCVQ